MATALISLLAAFIAGLLTVGSTMLTLRHTDRRDDSRWQREREREHDLWAREDAARSYEHRREAYSDFIKEFHRRWMALIVATNEELGGRADHEFSSDYLDPLYGNLVQIQIFGTEEVAALAEEASEPSLIRGPMVRRSPATCL